MRGGHSPTVGPVMKEQAQAILHGKVTSFTASTAPMYAAGCLDAARPRAAETTVEAGGAVQALLLERSQLLAATEQRRREHALEVALLSQVHSAQ